MTIDSYRRIEERTGDYSYRYVQGPAHVNGPVDTFMVLKSKPEEASIGHTDKPEAGNMCHGKYTDPCTL